MANYERMWNSLKRELQQLEEHYSDMRLNYAQKGQPTLAAQFKERGDGVAEAIMYMDLAEQDDFNAVKEENLVRDRDESLSRTMYQQQMHTESGQRNRYIFRRYIQTVLPRNGGR